MLARLCSAAVVISTVALAACTELPVIEPGTCGNGVVEDGEDCDKFAPEGQRCRNPGEPGQCRLDCSLASAETFGCPSGWGCGVDGVCRAPTGTYRVDGERIAIGASTVLTGDFDGDRRHEILALGNPTALGQALPTFVLPQEALAEPRVVPFGVPIATPTVLDLTGDGIDDVAFATTAGLGVLLGRADDAPEPTAYPLTAFPDGLRIRMATIGGYRAPLGQNIVALVSSGSDTSVVSTEETLAPIVQLPWPLEDLIGEPIAANVISGPQSPCDELLLAYRGQQSVLMVTLCDEQGVLASHGTVTPVATLPDGVTLQMGMHAGDFNGDGRVDLVVGSSERHGYACFGCGEGQFCAEPQASPETPGRCAPLKLTADSACQDELVSDWSFPLAIGDLNADGLADAVTSTEILLTRRFEAKDGTVHANVCLASRKLVGDWTVARIEDLNRDGLPDVIAGSSHAFDLNFYAGTGQSRLNQFTLPTHAPVERLITGDFDGDLVRDVALVEATGAEKDSVSIAYGRMSTSPEPPQVVAHFHDIDQLATAHFDASDAVEEIGVVSFSEDGTRQMISVLIGFGGRQPFGPFGLEAPRQQSPLQYDSGSPLISVADDWNADGQPDMAAVALSEPCDTLSSCLIRLWLVEGGSEARLVRALPGPQLPSEASLLSTRAPDGPRVAVSLLSGDLNGNGTPELVLVAPRSDGSGTGVWSVEPGADWRNWQDRSLEFLVFNDWDLATASSARLADLDGNGALDLVVPFRDAAGTACLGVLWNDGAGQLAAMQPSVLPIAPAPAGFTVLPDATVVAVAQGLAQALRFDSTTTDWVTTVLDLQGGLAVAGADVTGDGIHDLIIASSAGIQVAQGVPVLP